VRVLVEIAFEMVGRRIEWRGKSGDEKGVDTMTGAELVAIDPRYFRPTEVDLLLGDATKARDRLGWRHTISFREMVSEMVREDLKLIARDQDRKDIHG
jgi:GDPmannose 4,6-dehydratase